MLKMGNDKMNFRLNHCVIALAACALVVGCQRSQIPTEKTVSIKPAIIADCIAQYFRTDGTGYITQQTHYFNPDKRYFSMICTEPSGKVVYTLENTEYSVSEVKNKILSGLPKSFCTPILAVGIYYGFCAGGDLLDISQIPALESVKLEGRWYQTVPIRLDELDGLQVMLYKALDTDRIELLQINDGQDGKWLLRSYNLRYSIEFEKKLPRSIDVFDVQKGLASKKLAAQFQYINIQNEASNDDR